MARAGRPQGAMKGATEAANELARFLRDTSDRLTVREMAQRYGGGKSLWGEYRSGARIIPLGRLNAVIQDRVRDVRGRERMLARARQLHDEALAAEVARAPAPSLREALARAEADLAESGRLVRTLLALVTMLQEEIGRMPPPASGAAKESDVPPPARGPGTEPAAPVPDARLVPLDEAFDRLGTAWTLRKAAMRTYADARAQAAGNAPDTAAGTELALALARADYELELHRESVRELWSRIRGNRPVDEVLEDEVLEGVVLERTDRAASAAAVSPSVREAARDALPVHLAASGPSPAGAARAGLAAFAAALALIVLAGVVGFLIGGREVLARATAAEPARLTPSWQTAVSPTAPGPAASPPSTAPVSPGASPAHSSPAPRPVAGPSRPGPSAPASAPSPSPSTTPSRPSEPSPPPLPDGLLRLTNVASRMCLSAPDGSATPAEGLVQTGCGADFEQFWQLTREGTSQGEPVYAVRNRHNGLCLSVDAARTTNDAIITQYPCGDGSGLFPDQFWAFRYDGRYHAWHLVSRNSGKCVAIRSGGGALEQALQGDCAENPWLLWRT